MLNSRLLELLWAVLFWGMQEALQLSATVEKFQQSTLFWGVET